MTNITLTYNFEDFNDSEDLISKILDDVAKIEKNKMLTKKDIENMKIDFPSSQKPIFISTSSIPNYVKTQAVETHKQNVLNYAIWGHNAVELARDILLISKTK